MKILGSSIEDITITFVRLIGYCMMIYGAYKIDINIAIIIAGFIAWMPTKWIR